MRLGDWWRSQAAAAVPPLCPCRANCVDLPRFTRSSVATEWVLGRSIDEVLTIKNSDIAAHLKLPPVKLHCSMLAEDAIKAAVRDYAKKNNMEVAGAPAASGGAASAAAASAKMTA